MKTYLLLFLIFSLLLQFSSGEGEQCGIQANGTLCPNDLCCSGFGFCGSTEPYCGPGCQSQCDYDPTPLAPPPPDPYLPVEQCGSQANGTLCPNGLCCSKWGFCGTTEPYCGSGCQSQCTPPAPAPAPTPPNHTYPSNFLLQVTSGEGEQCGIQANGALCPNDLCCSKWGFCGSTEPYCGTGCQSQCDYDPTPLAPPPPDPYLPVEQCGSQANGALCPNDLCCSKWGFCGTTEPYCGSGCQSQCTPPAPAPTPTNPTYPRKFFLDAAI